MEVDEREWAALNERVAAMEKVLAPLLELLRGQSENIRDLVDASRTTLEQMKAMNERVIDLEEFRTEHAYDHEEELPEPNLTLVGADSDD